MCSNRTKQCIRRKRVYTLTSWLLCFGMFLFLIIYGFATKWNGSDSEVTQHIKAILVSCTLSLLPIVIISFLVKDKIKPTIRMINVILASYLVGEWFMFVTGAFMLLDTYIISNLIEQYRTRVITNKEIDKRESDTI